jgi:hypothetical protein
MFLKYNNLGFFNKKSINIAPHNVLQDDSITAVNCYHEINDQVINEFGIEESFLVQKDKEQDIAMLKLEFIINGNKMKRTEWRIKEAEIETPEQHNNKQMELSKELAIISKGIGVGIIDIKQYSIFQYLTAKKSLTNGN